jgi:hypothetical protein
VKAAVLVDVPAAFRTREFIAERNKWYRRLEAEGHAVDELGYKQSRERAKKGVKMSDPAHADAELYGHDASAAEQMNVRRFGRPLPAWDLERAEYWRLVAEQVEHLPANYYGTPLLRRWAELGEIKTAAKDTGTTRWKARRIVEKFLLGLKRKGVLR